MSTMDMWADANFIPIFTQLTAITYIMESAENFDVINVMLPGVSLRKYLEETAEKNFKGFRGTQYFTLSSIL